jgi:uncharacterized protein (TIGR03382 family)
LLGLMGMTGMTTLHPNDVVTATITLAPAHDADLAGANFVVHVDGTTLSYPITGKVVTPHSRIAPAQLDLGTACVGEQISGSEMLINDGTATLRVEPPSMDHSFLPLFDNPSTYPTDLAPGKSATISITPATSTSGPMHGTLTWSDNVPDTYTVDVDLTYIADGTAVSPSQLDFGNVFLSTEAFRQAIVLENCGADVTMVTIKGLTATQGSSSAWNASPRPSSMPFTLAPREKLTISTGFSPKSRGVYRAHLDLDLNGTPQSVDLVGEGIGLDPDKTSFYACACSGPGAPQAAWPFVLVLVVVLRRRR